MSRAATRRVAMPGRQRGLSLATAIFVITVMALLAALIFQLVRNNADTTAEEINLIRAFYAAESGVQFGLNRAFPPEPAGVSSCPVSTTYTLEEGGFNGCSAEVSCASFTVDTTEHFTITSTGTCGEVSRTIQVRAR